MSDFPADIRHVVPAMPIHPQDESMMLGATVIMTAVTVGLLIYWVLGKERREHGFILPLAIAGGLLSALQEPILDVLVLFWYPTSDSLVAFSAFGRDVPWFVVIGYGWYVGGLPYLVYRMIDNGIQPRSFWKLFVAIMAIDMVGISVPVLMGVCGFYGNQPYDIWGYPFWWAGLDGAHPMLGGLVLYWLVPKLPKPFQPLAVFLTPAILLGAVSGATVWPIALALNTGLSTAMVQLAGAATFVLGTMLVAASVLRLSGVRRNQLSSD